MTFLCFNFFQDIVPVEDENGEVHIPERKVSEAVIHATQERDDIIEVSSNTF